MIGPSGAAGLHCAVININGVQLCQGVLHLLALLQHLLGLILPLTVYLDEARARIEPRRAQIVSHMPAVLTGDTSSVSRSQLRSQLLQQYPAMPKLSPRLSCGSNSGGTAGESAVGEAATVKALGNGASPSTEQGGTRHTGKERGEALHRAGGGNSTGPSARRVGAGEAPDPGVECSPQRRRLGHLGRTLAQGFYVVVAGLLGGTIAHASLSEGEMSTRLPD